MSWLEISEDRFINPTAIKQVELKHMYLEGEITMDHWVIRYYYTATEYFETFRIKREDADIAIKQFFEESS